jgi:prepilin peptidase CpaA
MTLSALMAFAGISIFVFTMIYAALTDLTSYRIENGLVLALLVLYPLLAPWAGFSAMAMGWSALMATAVLVAGFAFFAFGWIGGGDAKLVAATVLWLGSDHISAYLVYAALFGGVLTLALLQFRALVLPPVLLKQSWIARLYGGGSGVPYGVALAMAGLAVLPQSAWMGTLN